MFLGGAAVEALGASAAYEINANSEMNQLEDDYKNERVSRAEYESRKSKKASSFIKSSYDFNQARSIGFNLGLGADSERELQRPQ